MQPAALAVLEGLATVTVSRVGERNDWYAEASTADAIIVGGETFVTGEVMDRILRSGEPFSALTNLTPGFEVSGAVLGLVGLRRIGSRVAAIAQVLGMKVLAFDPFVTSERANTLGVELVPSLAELLPRAHVVSLHCPSTPETYHIINAETLSLMSKGSYGNIRSLRSNPFKK